MRGGARADRLSASQRRVLLAVAAALLLSAAALTLFRPDCTRTSRDEVRTPPSAGQPQRVEVTEKRCAAATISSAPAVALVLLAGLVLSPWITRITVGAVGLDTRTSAEVGSPEGSAQALGGLQAPDAGVAGLVDSARARIAELFVEGADLPAPWDRATLLFVQPTLAGPDLIFTKTVPGQAADVMQQQQLLGAATPALNAAVRAAGEVKQTGDPGPTVVAAVGTNLEGRPVSAVAALLVGPPVGPVTAEVAAGLVDLADSWARVVIDVLLLEDDT